jgi:hypothetical protein
MNNTTLNDIKVKYPKAFEEFEKRYNETASQEDEYLDYQTNDLKLCIRNIYSDIVDFFDGEGIKGFCDYCVIEGFKPYIWAAGIGTYTILYR